MEKMKKVQLTKNNQDQGVGENFLRQKRRVSLTPQTLPGCQSVTSRSFPVPGILPKLKNNCNIMHQNVHFCPENSPFFWMVLVPVPEKIGPGKKYRYQKKILGTVTLCWMHHDDEANYDITLNSVAWTVSLTFCMFYI